MKSKKRRNLMILALYFLGGSFLDGFIQMQVTGFRDGLPVVGFLIGLFILLKAVNIPKAKKEEHNAK